VRRKRQRMLEATGKLDRNREPDPASRFLDGVALDFNLAVDGLDRVRVLLGAKPHVRCLVRTEYHPGRTMMDQNAVRVGWGSRWTDWLGWALFQPLEWGVERPVALAWRAWKRVQGMFHVERQAEGGQP